MNDRTVLVTGATGLIGGEAVLTLLDRGWRVYALARGEDPPDAARRIHGRLRKSRNRSWDPKQLSCLSGSVTEPNLGLNPAQFRGIGKILHCAGETSFNNDDGCWATNVGAAERLVELGKTLPHPPRIYFVSTASVCMSPGHSEIVEDTPFGGYDNGYTRSKRRAEEILLNSGLDVVVIRPTIVFSRGVEDRKMARAMLWVIPAIIELGSTPVDAGSRLDIIPIDFAAHALELLLSRPNLRHRRYHISAGIQSAATCDEFKQAVGEIYPRARSVTFSAKGPGKKAAGSSTLQQRLTEAISFYVPFMSADIVYSNDRITRELGDDLGTCPKVTDYLSTLLKQFEFQEGIEESAKP